MKFYRKKKTLYIIELVKVTHTSLRISPTDSIDANAKAQAYLLGSLFSFRRMYSFFIKDMRTVLAGSYKNIQDKKGELFAVFFNIKPHLP